MKSYKNFKTETVGIPEFDKIRKDGRLLIEYIRGSVSYGLDTPESDKDSGGIYMCSIKELLGYNTYKEEISDSKNDNKWYELNKFISLLVKANPNILEALFVDDNFINIEGMSEEQWLTRDIIPVNPSDLKTWATALFKAVRDR